MLDKQNVFAVILAGGSGTRMGNPEKPKQYLMLGSKPIIVHTIEKFCATNAFDGVLVLCPSAWVQQTKDILRHYSPECCERVTVVPGGSTRSETVRCAVSYLCENYETNDDTVLVTHDAVRPFVSYRIIAENIASARENGACDTVVPATDTIVHSDDGEFINNIPNRISLYQGQTPQSFKLHELKDLIASLTPEEEMLLTDACKIYILRGRKVALVRGDVSNMKITYPQDMRVAAALIGE